MRAAVMRGKQLTVEDWPEPRPAQGQTLVRPLACGICGSDLHFLQHGERMAELSEQANRRDPSPPIDFSRGIVMGHEFVGEVLEHGPDTNGFRPGTTVVAMPVLMTDPTIGPNGLPTFRSIGYSNDILGGYGEQMLLSTMLMLDVPNGLAAQHAALTEPLAVGVHAVAKASLVAGDTAVVHGCGPVGLAVIAALRLVGVEAIVAGDFSARRRELARQLGATLVVDPTSEPTIDAWYRIDGRSSLVQFECIGVPGILDMAMREAPRLSRIVVVGACMEPDRVHPLFGISKELNVQFVLAYTADEFAATLRNLAEGRLDAAPLITSTVPLGGIAVAFEALASPDQEVKILVEP